MENSSRVVEERRYVHLDPETVTNIAESLGISNLAPGVANELAQDVTYRLREISDVCSQFLRHSRKRKLSTDILNKAFKCKNIEPVLGHKKNTILGCDSFEYLPEAEVFVESDREINLVNESLQGNPCLPESQVTVTASWISLQGVALKGPPEDCRVNPANNPLTPIQVQFYSNITNNILGESHQLCLLSLQDLRSNPRLTPLLPFLVNFSRVCLSRYKENSLITSRITRLISALFSNPHINLSPKPYLSYLVSALLGFLIKENKDPQSAEQVRLVSYVLSQALRRWATPTNQLRAQTLKALNENCGNHLSYSQYGSLTSLCILGPQVLEECLLPNLESLISNLWSILKQQSESKRKVRNELGNWSLGLLRVAGTDLIKYWRQTKSDYKSVKNLYTLLDAYFGDSLVPFIPGSGCGRIVPTKDFGKMKIRKIQSLSNPSTSKQDSGDTFQEPRELDRDFFSAQENFNFLADMGVPSDIFESNDLVSNDRQENDFSGYFKPRTVNLSKGLGSAFPDIQQFKFKARAIKLNLGPCKQLEPDRYTQKRQTASERGRRLVPWRNLVVGGRVGTKSRRSNIPTLYILPDYIDVLRYF